MKSLNIETSAPKMFTNLDIDLVNDLPNPFKETKVEIKPKESSKVFEVLLLCVSTIFSVISYSVLAPFFPTKAKSNGVSEFWIGMIVAQLQVSKLVVLLFIGTFSDKLNPKTGFSLGLLITGIGNSLMGLIQWSPPGATYIALCMITRTIEGFGTSFTWTYVWVILFSMFKENQSKYIGLIGMCTGFGTIIGPALGGVIYHFGERYLSIGFSLTFWSVGVSLMITALAIQIFLRKIENDNKSDETISISTVLKSLDFSLTMLIIINYSFMLGYTDTTLDLHLSTITKLMSTSKGGIFLLFGLFYAIFTQGFGCFADKFQDYYLISIIGLIVTMGSLVIIGPLPVIPIAPNIPFVIIGVITLGLGLGALNIGAYSQAFKNICGDPKEGKVVYTFGAMGKMIETAYSIGTIVGPLAGGLLLDNFSYGWATAPIIALQIIVLILTILFKWSRSTQNK